MALSRSTLLRGGAAALTSVAIALSVRPARAQPLERLPFTLNWKLQGIHGAIFLAQDRGYFRAEGLNPEIVAGDGSANVVNRLAGGAFQIGLGDVGAVIRFNTLNPDKRVKAIYNQTPADLVVIALRGRGITKPEDLRGRIVGAPVGDSAYKMFPAFSAATGVPASAIRWEHMAPNIREAMLMQGRVDAITANEGTALFNLKAAGVKEEDIVFLRYNEFGVNIVNIGMLANETYLKEKPETARKIVRAVHRGYADAIANPPAAVDALLKRDPLLRRDIEAERLQYSVVRMIEQPDVREGGLGFYSETTVARSIEIVATAENLSTRIAVGDLIDNSFLPPADTRQVPAAART